MCFERCSLYVLEISFLDEQFVLNEQLPRFDRSKYHKNENVFASTKSHRQNGLLCRSHRSHFLVSIPFSRVIFKNAGILALRARRWSFPIEPYWCVEFQRTLSHVCRFAGAFGGIHPVDGSSCELSGDESNFSNGPPSCVVSRFLSCDPVPFNFGLDVLSVIQVAGIVVRNFRDLQNWR